MASRQVVAILIEVDFTSLQVGDEVILTEVDFPLSKSERKSFWLKSTFLSPITNRLQGTDSEMNGEKFPYSVCVDLPLWRQCQAGSLTGRYKRKTHVMPCEVRAEIAPPFQNQIYFLESFRESVPKKSLWLKDDDALSL